MIYDIIEVYTDIVYYTQFNVISMTCICTVQYTVDTKSTVCFIYIYICIQKYMQYASAINLRLVVSI